MKNRKMIILVIMVLICIVTSISTYKNYEGKNIEEIKEKTNKNNKLVFYIQQDNGSYKEETEKYFPKGDYYINKDKTKCTNFEEEEVTSSLLFENGRVVITGKNTAYCEIYFDKCKGPVGTILAGKDKVSKCEIGGMYRYQGTDNVNNWICFGTEKNCSITEEDVDKYMYRIIGVTPNNELKLLKETMVVEEGNRTFKWNSSTECGPDGELCMWPNSMIFKRLNGISNGSISGISGDTNIFVGNSYYEYLNNGSIWFDKIIDYTWKYGGTNGKTGGYNGFNMYEMENAHTKTVNSKIGLMYQHDYLYAHPGGLADQNSRGKAWVHHKKDGYNLGFDDTFNSAGLRENNEFRFTTICINGDFCGNLVKSYSNTGYRPVFYLTPDITFKEGTTGEKENPYRIEMPEPDILKDLRKNDEKDTLTEDLVGGMYRYQGTDNVNNYICFGTTRDCSKSSEDIDKYMYRIIGITPEGELKLVKETFVNENGRLTFLWNNKYTANDCESDGSKCTWPNSMIYKRLNGKSNGNITGTKGDTNIFIGNGYYEYLNNGSTWLDKIEDYNWKYGDTSDNGNYNGDDAYAIENAFHNSITAKIGLQYLHDYYYAYPRGNPGSINNAKNAWIHSNVLISYLSSYLTFEWLITRADIQYNQATAYAEHSSGQVNYSNLNYEYDAVRPVFYLTKDTTIRSGTGSKTDPYILDVQ